MRLPTPIAHVRVNPERARHFARYAGMLAYMGQRDGLACEPPPLYMAAVAASRTKSPLADLHASLRVGGKSPKLAFVALARKLLVTANAILRDNSP